MLRLSKSVLVVGLLGGGLLASVSADRGARTGAALQGAPQAPAVDQSVPANLRDLLTPRQSEMRLVALRYNADRNTLSGNYQGDGGGRGGRGGPPPGPPAASPLSVSPNRIARLKRFDLDWQAALGRIDAAKLSAPAQSDLDGLKKTIQTNLTQLDMDGAALAELAPLVPFAPRIIALYEARVRMEDVNSQEAAGEVTAVTKEIAQVRARLEKGLSGATDGDALRVGRELAIRGAEATDSLRGSLTNWFNFRNGYDPLFTWWMGLPFKQVDEALQGYAALLRDKVAPSGQTSNLPPPAAKPIPPATSASTT